MSWSLWNLDDGDRTRLEELVEEEDEVRENTLDEDFAGDLDVVLSGGAGGLSVWCICERMTCKNRSCLLFVRVRERIPLLNF